MLREYREKFILIYNLKLSQFKNPASLLVCFIGMPNL